jgi:hypothetical protein
MILWNVDDLTLKSRCGEICTGIFVASLRQRKDKNHSIHYDGIKGLVLP